MAGPETGAGPRFTLRQASEWEKGREKSDIADYVDFGPLVVAILFRRSLWKGIRSPVFLPHCEQPRPEFTKIRIIRPCTNSGQECGP